MSIKPLKTFRLSQEVLMLLKKIAEAHNRGQSNMIEVLILEEAKKLKIKTR